MNDDDYVAKKVIEYLKALSSLEKSQIIVHDLKDVIKTITDDPAFISDLYLDNLKIKLIDEFFGLMDYYIAGIAKTLSSDNLKKDCISILSPDSDDLKISILKSMKSEVKKAESLEYISDENAKKEIVLSFKDPNNQLKAFSYLKFSMARFEIASLFEDDMLLVKAMDYFEYDDDKFKLAIKITNLDAILLAIDKLTNENYKVALAKNIYSTDELSGDSIKETRVLPYLKNFHNRMELLGSFVNADKFEALKEFEISKLEKNINYWQVQSKDFVSKSPLNLPSNLTIGVELEAVGMYPSETSLYFKILYKNRPQTQYWNIKHDDTLSVGTEISSPILTSSEKNMEELYIIAKTMQELGLEIDPDCGGHIHFGSNFLKYPNFNFFEPALINLINIWCEAEEIFYKMSNGEGKVLRKDAMYFAGGISEVVDEKAENGHIEEDDVLTFNDVYKEISTSRYNAINFQNMKVGRINTIEFRVSNGTITPSEIFQNIYLYGRLLVVAKDIAYQPDKYVEKLSAYNNRDVSEAEKVEALLSLLFEKEEEKNIYRRRWNSVKNEEIYDDLQAKIPKFRRGDYSFKNQAKKIAENDVSPREMDECIAIFFPDLDSQRN